jgi:hypothetical protein
MGVPIFHGSRRCKRRFDGMGILKDDMLAGIADRFAR